MKLTVEEIAEWTAKAVKAPSRQGYYGSIFTRTMEIDRAGDGNPGDTHNQDHTTVLPPGLWLVKVRKPNGEKIERSFRVADRTCFPIHINKDYWHEIFCLDGEAHYLCTFATRDKDGELADAADVDKTDLFWYE